MKDTEQTKKCSTHCDWPKCTFADCMEKHPEEWEKGGVHTIIHEALDIPKPKDNNESQKTKIQKVYPLR